jgi:hypothetical protein
LARQDEKVRVPGLGPVLFLASPFLGSTFREGEPWIRFIYSVTKIFRFFVTAELSSNHSLHWVLDSSTIHTRSRESPSLNERRFW